MIIADMVWPAIFIAGSVFQFWFVVIITIIVEALCIIFFLRVSFPVSILISTIGNIVSGLFGTIFFTIFMIFIELPIDLLIKGFSFSFTDWILSYIVMCFGSILIEILTVKLIWKFNFKKLLLPLSIGNVLSYLIIIYLNNFNFFYKGLQ